MYTINDIQIFIVTHNRATYLDWAIKSLLNQTVKPKITILDNESTDCTEYIANLNNCKYIKTNGFMGNYYKAKELINKPYCMLFHDDDLLNPEYLEFALELINKHNPSIITTKYIKFQNENNPPYQKINRDYYLFNSQKEFARYMIGVEEVSYAPAIYKSECFLKEDLEYEKYGKFNDWMLMAKISKYGKSIITADKNIMLARIHGGQDTRNIATALNGEQITNWDKFFYDILFDTDIELMSKSYHFLKSKYDQFTTQQFKRQFSFNDIHELFLKKCPNAPRVMNVQKLKEIKLRLEKTNLIRG